MEHTAPERPPFHLPVDRIGLVLGPAAMLAWIWLVDPGQLTPEAHRLTGVMLLTIIWWITEPIPIPATGLAAVALAVFVGAVPKPATGDFQPARVVLTQFGDPSLFFLLGGMFIGRAMSRHGLDRRMALSLLCTRWAGRSPAAVLAALGLSVALVSMWISNTAATAMIYPVAMGMISVLAAGAGPSGATFAHSRYASALLLITAYASSVGGISTPIGTGTNIVAMGLIRQEAYLGRPIDFLSWATVGIPLMLVIFAGLFLWLRGWASSSDLDMPALRNYLRQQRDKLGPWNRGEINTLAVFLVVVSLWVTPGVLAMAISYEARADFSSRFPEEVVALLAPVFLFLLPVDWKNRKFSLEVEDFSHIDWGAILLFGAGLSLGSLMVTTGLAKAVGEYTFEQLGTNDVWVITAVAIAGGILLSEFTSNAATAATLIPVIWNICKVGHVDPLPPLMGVTLAASFGSAFPVSTPPNAIVYSSGLIPAHRMVVAGIGLDLIAGIAIWCVLRLAFDLGWTPVPK